MTRRKFTASATGSRCAGDGIAQVRVSFEDGPKGAGGRLGIEVQSYPSARVGLDVRVEDIEPLVRALGELARKVRSHRVAS